MDGGLLSDLARLRWYERAWLAGDLRAGVTAAAYMVLLFLARAGNLADRPVGILSARVIQQLLMADRGGCRACPAICISDGPDGPLPCQRRPETGRSGRRRRWR